MRGEAKECLKKEKEDKKGKIYMSIIVAVIVQLFIVDQTRK